MARRSPPSQREVNDEASAFVFGDRVEGGHHGGGAVYDCANLVLSEVGAWRIVRLMAIFLKPAECNREILEALMIAGDFGASTLASQLAVI